MRGRRLAAFRGSDIRPTSDQVREAIFDLLGFSLKGFRVLDLFAGTGSLGIEALSRGAMAAMFVDHSFKAMELIRKNVKLCGLENSAALLKRDLSGSQPFGRFLQRMHFSLIFLDPPYGKGLILPILSALQQKRLLAEAAMVVAQSEERQELPDALGKLRKAKERTYGSTRITILENLEGS